MADVALRAASAATLVLFPALIVKGVRLRRRIPKIPEAAGPTQGAVAGREPALRLLVLGESTAAGVGAAVIGGAARDALSTRTAARAAARRLRPIGQIWRDFAGLGAATSPDRRRESPCERGRSAEDQRQSFHPSHSSMTSRLSCRRYPDEYTMTRSPSVHSGRFAKRRPVRLADPGRPRETLDEPAELARPVHDRRM